jgi:hypothetical protein
MIEFKRPESPRHDREYHVYIDGERLDGLSAIGSLNDYLRIFFNTRKAQEKVLAYPISSFPPLNYFNFYPASSPFELITAIIISPKSSNNRRYVITFVSEPDLSAWSRPYGFSSYCEALSEAIKVENYPEVDFSVYDNDEAGFKTSFEIIFPYSSPNVPIGKEIDKWLRLLKRLHEHVHATLTSDCSKIEVRKIASEKIKSLAGDYTRGSYQLFIDGEPIDEIKVTGGGEATNEGAWFAIHVPSLEMFDRIAAYSFDELPERVYEIIIIPISQLEFLRYIHIDKPESRDGVDFVFSFNPDLSEWQKSCTPNEYFQAFESIASSTTYPKSEVALNNPDEGMSQGFFAKFSSQNSSTPMMLTLSWGLSTLQRIQAAVEHLIHQEKLNDDNTLVSKFNFPTELRVPCEQYLLFFGQFLRDLGVEVATDIKHEAGQVLFSVTPTNKEEALDRIQEALMVYLGMSASPVNDLTALDYEIAVQRLVAEVQTLQSRVTLARAELQLKEATIQQQQIAIEHLRPEGGLMLTSLKEMSPHSKEDDREEVIDGLVAVKKFEWHFLEVGIPELYRRVKQLFSERKK